MTKQIWVLAMFIGMTWRACGGDAVVPPGNETNHPPHLGADTSLKLSRPSDDDIWVAGVGEGFRRNSYEAGFALGVGLGVPLSEHQTHDMALANLHYGWMFYDLTGKGKWYQGNWEFLGEFFGGGQYHPRNAYVAGLSTIFRYNFATGTRWVPFIDGGGGVSLTDIHRPDLSSTFQFNAQGGFGVNYFWRRNSAFLLQYRFLHLSNAGTEKPNGGVNTAVIYAGYNWFF